MITVDRLTDAWPERFALGNLYDSSFAQINTKAAQKHLMPEDDLFDVFSDERIAKYVARDHADLVLGDPRVVGLAVMTSNLHAWPLISPQFFERAYPGRTVFYIGFVCARRTSPAAFPMLIKEMQREVAAADGVFAMDFALANITERRLPQVTARLLASIDPDVKFSEIDRQVFYAGEYPRKRP